MDDLISRQEAIDAHYEYCNKHPDASFPVWSLKILKDLPSTLPDSKELSSTHKALDTISRHSVLKAINNMLKECDSVYVTSALRNLEVIVADLPSAQPGLSEYSDKLWKKAYERGRTETQQRWIPCSERLPDEEVLCCDTRGEMIIGYPYPDEESNTGYGAVLDDVVMIDCIAWMPLPEPYKEGK